MTKERNLLITSLAKGGYVFGSVGLFVCGHYKFNQKGYE